MEKTSSAAQEESSFLTEHMQSLLDERTALREALEKAQREKEVGSVPRPALKWGNCGLLTACAGCCQKKS